MPKPRRSQLSKHALCASTVSERWLYVGDSRGEIFRLPHAGRKAMSSQRPRARAIAQLCAAADDELLVLYTDGQATLLHWDDGIAQTSSHGTMAMWAGEGVLRFFGRDGVLRTIELDLSVPARTQKLSKGLAASFSSRGSLLVATKGVMKLYDFDGAHEGKQGHRQLCRGMVPDLALHLGHSWLITSGDSIWTWNRASNQPNSSSQQRRIRFRCADAKGDWALLGDQGGQLEVLRSSKSALPKSGGSIRLGEPIRTVQILPGDKAIAGTAKGSLFSFPLP